MHFYGWPHGWAELDSIGHLRRGGYPHLDLARELFDECAEAARIAGAAPSVRYEVRARQGRKGEPAVSLAADWGPDLDDRLRCCLTRTGASFVPTLLRDEELRFDGGPHGHGVRLHLRAMGE
jgi:hypothetical protein